MFERLSFSFCLDNIQQNSSDSGGKSVCLSRSEKSQSTSQFYASLEVSPVSEDSHFTVTVVCRYGWQGWEGSQ